MVVKLFGDPPQVPLHKVERLLPTWEVLLLDFLIIGILAYASEELFVMPCMRMITRKQRSPLATKLLPEVPFTLIIMSLSLSHW